MIQFPDRGGANQGVVIGWFNPNQRPLAVLADWKGRLLDYRGVAPVRYRANTSFGKIAVRQHSMLFFPADHIFVNSERLLFRKLKEMSNQNNVHLLSYPL